MTNPLAEVEVEFKNAVAELEAAKMAMVEAESRFKTRMMVAVRKAHKEGVTRYMVQKVTFAPQWEVAAWFGSLPMSKPGRRRKDDPLYALLQPETVEEVVEVEPVVSVPDGWLFADPRSSGVETAIPVVSPEGVTYTVLLTDQGDVAWLDADRAELSLEDRLLYIPDDVEEYVREVVWL